MEKTITRAAKSIGLRERFNTEFLIRTADKDRVRILLDDNRFTFIFVETAMRNATTVQVSNVSCARVELLRKLLKQLLYE